MPALRFSAMYYTRPLANYDHVLHTTCLKEPTPPFAHLYSDPTNCTRAEQSGSHHEPRTPSHGLAGVARNSSRRRCSSRSSRSADKRLCSCSTNFLRTTRWRLRLLPELTWDNFQPPPGIRWSIKRWIQGRPARVQFVQHAQLCVAQAPARNVRQMFREL